MLEYKPLDVSKLTYLLLPAAIAILAFLAISAMNPAETRLADQDDVLVPAYNAWSEGIDTVIFDTSGDIAYTIAAERQVYFDDDTSTLAQPVIRFYDAVGEQWNLVANTGRISAQQESDPDLRDIELIGNVQIRNEDSNGNLTLLSTQRLMLNLVEKAARTELRVQLRTNNLEHSATGMVAYMNRNRIEFFRDNKGRYIESAP